MYTALIAILFLALTGILLGCVIGFVAKIFAVKSDPRIEEVGEMLPGANCGGCGKAGCTDLARAIVMGESSPGACPVSSSGTVAQIAAFLGVDAGTSEKKMAVVLCGGNKSSTERGPIYNGILDCVSAMIVAGGPKGCLHGCLGFASCARACPFHAIEMIDGLAVVHNELCVGCGKCVETCPRHLIKLVPASAEVHVYCNSPEKGNEKKKFCSVSCIACRKCMKSAGEGQVSMEGFLARINYADPPDEGIVEKAACPTGCLRKNIRPAGKKLKEKDAA